MTVELRRLADAVELWILVQARSSRNEVGGAHDGALRVRVTPPPAEGRANRAVCRAVARALGARASDVSILSGERDRRKRIRVLGSPEALAASIGGLVREPRVV